MYNLLYILLYLAISCYILLYLVIYMTNTNYENIENIENIENKKVKKLCKIPIIYENPYKNDILYNRNIVNLEFVNYVKNNLQNKNLYDSTNRQFLFNLRYNCNISILYEKQLNTQKKLYNSLEYKLNTNKIFCILDMFLLLIINKGYVYDFCNYDYLLYSFIDKKSNLLENLDNKTINNKEQELYFIKTKLKKNIVLNFVHEPMIDISKMFIIHNNNIFEYYM